MESGRFATPLRLCGPLPCAGNNAGSVIARFTCRLGKCFSKPREGTFAVCRKRSLIVRDRFPALKRSQCIAHIIRKERPLHIFGLEVRETLEHSRTIFLAGADDARIQSKDGRELQGMERVGEHTRGTGKSLHKLTRPCASPHGQSARTQDITQRMGALPSCICERFRQSGYRVVDQNLHPISRPFGESPQSRQPLQQPIRTEHAHKIAHQNRLLRPFGQSQHLPPPRGGKQLRGVQHMRGLVPHASHQLNTFGLAHTDGRKAVKQRPIVRFQFILDATISKTGGITDGRNSLRCAFQEIVIILPGPPDLIAPDYYAIQAQILPFYFFPSL